MQVEIITIGDEILIGQIVDTNSAWMAVELNKAGIEIAQITSVHDVEAHIIESLELALGRADVVLMTGGIGPTKDDITKNTLCKFFGSGLVFNQQVHDDIAELLKHRARAMNELTATQAMVPEKATIIRNPIGTAAITWFEKDGKVVVSMPGVPYEMKQAMSNEIIPRLKSRYALNDIIHRTILVVGYPESALAIKIASWESALPASVRLAYLPNFNIVKLRLTSTEGKYEDIAPVMDQLVNELKLILKDAIIAEEDIALEKLIGLKLIASGLTLSAAESCTGGLIAHKITSVPGSSRYFKGGVVAYENQVKINLLQVKEADLQQFGAVSSVVAQQMAEGVQRLLNADCAVAVTGIAGPDGGTPEKPVGTVWISVRLNETFLCRDFNFSLNRQLNIERASQTALLMLLELLNKNQNQ